LLSVVGLVKSHAHWKRAVMAELQRYISRIHAFLVIAAHTLLSFFIRNETVIDVVNQTSKELESFIFITGQTQAHQTPVNSIAFHHFQLPVRIAQTIVPLFAYIETSFTVLVFSHRAATLSKLYIKTNPESYKL